MNDVHIISKLTVIWCGIKFEYIISEDFFHSLSDIDDDDSDSLDSYGANTFSNTESYSETCSNFQNNEFSDDFTDLACSCIQRLEYLMLENKINVKIDAVSFSVILSELKRSRTFRANVLKNFYLQYVKNKGICTYSLCDICNKNSVLMHVVIHLKRPKKNILDYKWNGKIQVLINEKCDLENAMAWLSTLGGAFSALGDTYTECAEKAGAISVQQLSIALRLGDPLTVCRCKIYMAMSLLQRGYFGRTKRIIRDLYKFSTEGVGSKDFRLKNMCIAVWNRLKYLKSLKKIKNTNKH